MSDWVKVTNDEFEVGIEIATLKKGLDFAIDKYIQENNDEMRYLDGK